VPSQKASPDSAHSLVINSSPPQLTIDSTPP